jgi:hypothetical protein
MVKIDMDVWEVGKSKNKILLDSATPRLQTDRRPFICVHLEENRVSYQLTIAHNPSSDTAIASIETKI